MPPNRKLVAVVMADVVGYSRLMERDESGTHARLRELRERIVSKAHTLGGRLVKTAGDGFLLEFAGATAALRWAIDVQRELAARNAGVADDAKLELRIGINLGDIIVEGDDIIGDGVNVAARLESWLDLAAAYSQSGDLEKAAKAKDELMRRVPTFTISRMVAKRISSHPAYERSMREHFYPGLRKAGVRE